jgi:hypothetical protein
LRAGSDGLARFRPEDFPERIQGTPILALRLRVIREYPADVLYHFERLTPKRRKALLHVIVDIGSKEDNDYLYPEDRSPAKPIRDELARCYRARSRSPKRAITGTSSRLAGVQRPRNEAGSGTNPAVSGWLLCAASANLPTQSQLALVTAHSAPRSAALHQEPALVLEPSVEPAGNVA